MLLKASLEALLVLTECHQSSQLWQGSETWRAAHCSLRWILSSSVRPLWLQLLRFVSDGYFCTSFEVTGACIVGADKRTIPNSQIKTEFNFFHLLLTNSLWHCEWDFSPRYCPAVSQFQKLAPSYGLMGPTQQFGIQILVLGAIMIWVSEGMKCVMAMVLMGISGSQECSKAMKPSTHFLYSWQTHKRNCAGLISRLIEHLAQGYTYMILQEWAIKIDESISFSYSNILSPDSLLDKVIAVKPGTQSLNRNQLDSVTCCVGTVSSVML